MANTAQILSYANTFSEWLVVTNALVRENNDIAANNYTKSTGTLFLNDPTLGLSVSKAATVQGQFQVTGTGSFANVQNSLQVGGQLFLTNTKQTLVVSGICHTTGNTFTTSSTSQVTIDTFAAATYRSADYNILMTSGTSYHSTKLSLLHDGTNVFLTQYGDIVSISSLGTFDASIATGTLSLRFTPTNASTSLKIMRDLIVV
jgi:hypothetical protein